MPPKKDGSKSAAAEKKRRQQRQKRADTSAATVHSNANTTAVLHRTGRPGRSAAAAIFATDAPTAVHPLPRPHPCPPPLPPLDELISPAIVTTDPSDSRARTSSSNSVLPPVSIANAIAPSSTPGALHGFRGQSPSAMDIDDNASANDVDVGHAIFGMIAEVEPAHPSPSEFATPRSDTSSRLHFPDSDDGSLGPDVAQPAIWPAHRHSPRSPFQPFDYSSDVAESAEAPGSHLHPGTATPSSMSGQQPENSLDSPFVGLRASPSPSMEPGPDNLRFPICTPGTSPTTVYHLTHPVWYIRLYLLVITYVHYAFHLPFAACDLLLFTFYVVLSALGSMPSDSPAPITLVTCLKRLSVEDRFTVLPLCPGCHKIFLTPIKDPASFKCPKCAAAVFSRARNYFLPDFISAIAPRLLLPPELKPLLVIPFRPVSSLIAEFLERDSMVDKMDEWRYKRRDESKLQDIMDGRVWKELKDPDGNPFFGSEDEHDEVRVGITFNIDWFQFTRTAISPSHSTGAASIAIANLDHNERYRTENLLVPFLTPGPKEPTAEQLQEYMVLVVDDLIVLYNEGMVCKASDRRVRVVVVAVICDHPAMCKTCGFAEKNHLKFPCTQCDVEASDLFSEKAMKNEFPRRDAAVYWERAQEWRDLNTASAQAAHFKKFGVRWFEFGRLPYFDPIRMTVIDPMHNLLLGVVKHQWYPLWIKDEKALREDTKTKTRELHDIHGMLESAEFPSWVGRIPKKIGYPAGGSLSADEWKTLALIFGPIALPIVWEDWIDEARADHDRASSRKKGKGKKGASTKETDDVVESAAPRMKDGEMKNFLKLSAALTIILGRTIQKDQLATAQGLLTDYLVTFRELYGEEHVNPSHHWAAHQPGQLLDFSTVYGFWAFLQERLNFVLKHFKTNNHGGGALEVSLMRSFNAMTWLRQMVVATRHAYEQSNSTDIEVTTSQSVFHRLLKTKNGERGTIETLSASQIHNDAQVPWLIGPSKLVRLDQSSSLIQLFLAYYNQRCSEDERLYLRSTRNRPQNAHLLDLHFLQIPYIILDGRRLVPMESMQQKTRRATIIVIHLPQHRQRLVAELLSVWQPQQSSGLPANPLAVVRYLKRARKHPLKKNLWEAHRNILKIDVWEYSAYEPERSSAFPAVIPFSWVISEAGRLTVRESKGSTAKLWVTIGLDKHAVPLT